MEMTQQVAVQIGLLKDVPGFILLRDYLQAQMDDALSAVELAQTDEEDRRRLMLWRAYRQILKHIDEITTEYQPLADEALEQLDATLAPPPLSSAALRAAIRRQQPNPMETIVSDIMDVEGEDE